MLSWRIFSAIPLGVAVLFVALAQSGPHMDRLEEKAQRNSARIDNLEKEAREIARDNVLTEGRMARMEATIEGLKASVERIDSTQTQILLGIAALFVSQAVQFFAAQGRRRGGD